MGGSTHNGHILTNCPVERSPRHPHVLFLSLHIRTLSLPYYVSYESVFQIHSTLPHGFSLPLSHIARIDLMTLHYYSAWFSLTTRHEYPVLLHLHLRSPSPVLPTLQSHSPLTQSQYLQHNTVLSLHRHTPWYRTSFLPFPFHTNLQFPTSTAVES